MIGATVGSVAHHGQPNFTTAATLTDVIHAAASISWANVASGE